MQMSFLKRRAQATLEYIVLISVVVGVIIAIINTQIRNRVERLWNKAANILEETEQRYDIPRCGE